MNNQRGGCVLVIAVEQSIVRQSTALSLIGPRLENHQLGREGVAGQSLLLQHLQATAIHSRFNGRCRLSRAGAKGKNYCPDRQRKCSDGK